MLGFNNLIEQEDAIGVVEMVLILVVIIGLVIIFKTQLTKLVKQVFAQVFSEAGELY